MAGAFRLLTPFFMPVILGPRYTQEINEGKLMLRRVGFVPLIALGLALSACGGSSASSASPSGSSTVAGSTAQHAGVVTTTSTTQPPNVKSMLLSVSDLPSGWSVDNSSSSSTNKTCYTDPLKQLASNSYAHINFAKDGSLPELGEEMASVSSGPQAFAKITSTLNSCKNFTESIQGQAVTGAGAQTATGSMGPMSAPKYGDQSAAYDATITSQGISLNQGFVVVQKGNILVLVALGNIGSLDSATLQQLTAIAVGKIPS